MYRTLTTGLWEGNGQRSHMSVELASGAFTLIARSWGLLPSRMGPVRTGVSRFPRGERPGVVRALRADPSGRVLGENFPQLSDKPERVVMTALENVAPEDQAGGAGFHRLACLLQHGLVTRLLAARDQEQ
jgi:hypothetical protein